MSHEQTTQDLILKLNPESIDLKKQQVTIEKLMRGLGIENYRAAVVKAKQVNNESNTKYGQSLLYRSIDVVTEGVKSYLEINSGAKPGKNTIAAKLLNLLEPDHIAFLSLKTVLDALTDKTPLTRLCQKLILYLLRTFWRKCRRKQPLPLSKHTTL